MFILKKVYRYDKMVYVICNFMYIHYISSLKMRNIYENINAFMGIPAKNNRRYFKSSA